MGKEVFVVPRKGLIVRDPTSMQPLPEKGFTVPLTGRDGTYWRRRILCGDVSVPPVAKSTKVEEKKK